MITQKFLYQITLYINKFRHFMKTIKLPIEYSNMEDMEILQEYTRLQNNVIRIAYNRFRERN